MSGLGDGIPLWAVGALASVFLAALFMALRFLIAADGDAMASTLVDLHPKKPVEIRRSNEAIPMPPMEIKSTQLERIRGVLKPEIDQGTASVAAKGESIVIGVSNVLLFASGSADVKPEFEPLAKRIAEALEKEPGSINIVGHTDNVRPKATSRFKSNFDLSVKRAESVAAALRPGISQPDRIAISGKGEDDPVASNDTAEGRGKNRRVDIAIPREETLGAIAQSAAVAVPDAAAGAEASPDAEETMQPVEGGTLQPDGSSFLPRRQKRSRSNARCRPRSNRSCAGHCLCWSSSCSRWPCGFVGPLPAGASFYPLGGFWTRTIILLLIWGTFFGVLGFKYWRRRKAQKALEEAVAGEQVTGDAEELKSRMTDAIATLRKASGGRNFLYELPWYVIIARRARAKPQRWSIPASNSRLPRTAERPPWPELAHALLRLWFAEEAVIIDTAGRYTTQDSEKEADEKSWTSFLSLLKETRTKQPINGVIITISLEYLMTLPEEEINRHANAIRKRLLELNEKLKVDFPVYALFTKADLVAGFNEFSSSFPEDRRRQVWGATFQTDDRKKNSVGTIPKEIDDLVERLTRKRQTGYRQSLIRWRALRSSAFRRRSPGFASRSRSSCNRFSSRPATMPMRICAASISRPARSRARPSIRCWVPWVPAWGRHFAIHVRQGTQLFPA